MEIPTNWTFQDPRIAEAFDAHVREQLPWYELATGLVAHIGRHFIPERGFVIDVGASTGNIGRALAPILEARRAALLAIDASQEMAERYSGPGHFLVADIRDGVSETAGADLIVSFLTLMFVPVADRGAVIENLKRTLKPGGGLFVVDKAAPRSGYLGTISSRLALAAKHEAGADPAAIIAKELSLAGIQRPLEPEELDGFLEIFRFGDFAGWLFQAPATRSTAA